MEDLAFIVGGIFIGLFVLGIVGVVLAALSRRNKVSRYWGIGLAVVLTILAMIAWQGSPALGAVPLAWGVLAGIISLWPKAK